MIKEFKFSIIVLLPTYRFSNGNEKETNGDGSINGVNISSSKR